MGFNRENYRRIKEEYDGKYLRAIEDARLRRAEVHMKVEGVEAIDKALSSIGLRIFEATLRGDREELDRINAENRQLLEKKSALLAAAGYAPDYTEVKYECDICGDTGVVDNRMCRCMRKKLVEAGFKSSGMYDLIQTQTFDNFDLGYYQSNDGSLERMRKIFEFIKRYSSSFDPETSPNVAMMGKTGLGKTHLSSAMAAEIIERGYDVYYTGAMAMFGDFEVNRFGSATSPEAEGNIEKYFSCDLLIIDDLGVEVSNQFTVSCLYNVINARLNKHRPTVINTNLTQEEFRKRYWDRIASRIFGEYTLLPFMGTDVRSQKLFKKK